MLIRSRAYLQSIKLNPLRDRASERAANRFHSLMRDGQCKVQLADWEKDYRKKYAAFLCDSEAQHPLISWEIVDWEDAPPLRILHYRGKRHNPTGQKGHLQRAVLRDSGKSGWRVGGHQVRLDVSENSR